MGVSMSNKQSSIEWLKNIHVLPTDKPSRLSKDENNKIWLSINFKYGINDNNKQNIYITSNEEIKEGDWYYLPRTNSVHKCIEAIELNLERSYGVAKINLTTDQDLIKGGVQAIDDEFLEWFVKNPSCEKVKIEKFHGINTSIAEISSVSGNDDYKWEGKGDFRDYKIIIPQEEQKQHLIDMIKDAEDLGLYKKQRTAVELIIADLDIECKSKRGMNVDWDMYLQLEKNLIIKAATRGYLASLDERFNLEEAVDYAEQYYNEIFGGKNE
jgi:hypothetical protein